ncbi:ADP-ribose pyrophosphatase NudF [Thermacetogenium phaeum DSM 12270]|jgi:ADP-ribose pyrophosphatase|uniref:ADP-ribose pyrophosphatase NudF n=1 Tax=Thermacetogenium phaeum (strain ATCC BAA-254 / DSM 26808 / PB) TaxID=1089553 RepID=K4LG60_THEPS|nr:NUDIX hydrolase [Thermacetogenium phaeum]AFV11818.1 ADP-ribose pyrophosphatase NudF [Thermacetogenium phaeum DSM 12270]
MNKDPEARLKERHLSSERVYDGSFIKVRVDTVWLPDGERAKREVVEHPGAVAILPLTERKEVVMVRQYRHATGEVLLELPAGKREGDEEPLACARRELEEETGLTASQWRVLFSFYTSPGFCDELIYLVLAKGLSQGEAHPDSGEFIDTVTVPVDEAKRMVFSGEIKDAKTAIGILALEAMGEV